MEIKKRLVIPLVKGTLDAFGFKITNADSIMCLIDLNVSPEGFPCIFKELDMVSILSVKIHTPFLVGLFSYCFLKEVDIRDGTFFEVRVSELKEYLSLSSGGKGFDVVEAVKELAPIQGDIKGRGMFSLFSDISYEKGILRFNSVYFAFLICHIMTYEERGSLYTSAISSDIVAGKQIAAKEVVFVVTSIAVRRGRGEAHITLNRLLQRCPTFGARFKELHSSDANRLIKSTLEEASALLKKYCYFPGKKVSLDISGIGGRFELGRKVRIIIEERGVKYGEKN